MINSPVTVGVDARKAIVDGFPHENVIVSDLHAGNSRSERMSWNAHALIEFWDLGKKLFKISPPEVMPERFLAGDIFDPSFLSPDGSPATPSSTPPSPPPALSTLTSLTPLQHRISVIHTGAFFHLFDDVKQRKLAHLLASLLSPLPGSMILGSHMGRPDTEEYKNGGWRPSNLHPGAKMFAHSPTSWRNLWVGSGGVFRPQDVTVWTDTQERDRSYMNLAPGDTERKGHLLIWSVTRV